MNQKLLALEKLRAAIYSSQLPPNLGPWSVISSGSDNRDHKERNKLHQRKANERLTQRIQRRLNSQVGNFSRPRKTWPSQGGGTRTRLAPLCNQCEASPPVLSGWASFSGTPSQGSNWALRSSDTLPSDAHNLENGLSQLLTSLNKGDIKTQLLFMPGVSGTRPLNPICGKASFFGVDRDFPTAQWASKETPYPG